jgi:hypothetical protein
MRERVQALVFMSVAMIALGAFGYFAEKRKRGAAGVRRFLISYCLAWPFMGAMMGNAARRTGQTGPGAVVIGS